MSKVCILMFLVWLSFNYDVIQRTSHGQDVPRKEPLPLRVGDDAPTIDVEFWFHDGKVEKLSLEHFEQGIVYVIEFWATWCPPCVAAMPNMSKLQEHFPQNSVRLISVSNEPRETVEKFLKSSVSGNQGQTFLDFKGKYQLTSDPDQSVYNDYMAASGNILLPTVFIVGKQGQIEWIGNHGQLRKTVDEVVQGTWDREEFAKNFNNKQEVMLAIRRMSVFRQSHADDPDFVLRALENEIASLSGINEPQVQILTAFRIQVLATCGRYPEVESAIREGFAAAGSNVESVGILASILPQLPENTELDRRSLAELAVTQIQNSTSTAEQDQAMSELGISPESASKLLQARVYAWAGLADEAEVAAKSAIKLAAGTSMESAVQTTLDEIRRMQDKNRVDP